MSTEAMLLVLVLTAAPAASLYVLVYAFRPWTTTGPGRALMLQSVGMAMLINMALVTLVLPDFPGRDPVRVTAFALWTTGVYYLLFSLMTSPGARNYWPFRWRRRPRRARHRAE